MGVEISGITNRARPSTMTRCGIEKSFGAEKTSVPSIILRSGVSAVETLPRNAS